jgi:hypothetical protein
MVDGSLLRNPVLRTGSVPMANLLAQFRFKAGGTPRRAGRFVAMLCGICCVILLCGCDDSRARFLGLWYGSFDPNVTLNITDDAMQLDLQQLKFHARYDTQKVTGDVLTALAKSEGNEFKITFTLADGGKSVRITGGPPYGGRWVRSKDDAGKTMDD